MAPTNTQLSFLLWAVAAITVCSESTSEMTLLEIRPYFPNNTLMYSQYACTKQEQECFKENKLLHEGDGKCHSLGGQGPCAAGEIFHADKAEAYRRGGHLRGTCHKPCPGLDHAPLAATGECMSRSDVESKVCRADMYLRAAMDVFGQWVCEWTTLICNPRPYVSGVYPEQYAFHTGICSPPALFGTLIDGGENVTVPDAKPADHPLLEYFINKTLFEREFSCTEEEKACLQYGRLLNTNGSCYRPNQWNPSCEPGETFHLDLDEAMKEDGRLVGTCNSPCKGFSHPQIKTGECVDFVEFSNQICRWEWGMQMEVDVFGRMACACAWSPDMVPPPPPSLPSPPANPDHCRAPDFSNPIVSPSYDVTLTLGFSLPCSEEEFACLREGKVLMSGACHALRTRGPCAQGEELVLDKEALAHARLQPKCSPTPCPEGSVRVPIDGRCLTHQQVISLLCPEQHVALDEFGGWQCDYQADNWPGNLTSIIRHEDEGLCELLEKYGAPVPMPYSVQHSKSSDGATNNNSSLEAGSNKEYHSNEV